MIFLTPMWGVHDSVNVFIIPITQWKMVKIRWQACSPKAESGRTKYQVQIIAFSQKQRQKNLHSKPNTVEETGGRKADRKT